MHLDTRERGHRVEALNFLVNNNGRLSRDRLRAGVRLLRKGLQAEESRGITREGVWKSWELPRRESCSAHYQRVGRSDSVQAN